MASYFPMIKNSAQRIVFPILDADGDPVTGAAADTPDSEYSLDGASFVDIADEIHEIATASGIYYLDLAAGETNGDVVCIQVKTATAGTKTTVLVFYTAAQSLDTIDTNVDSILTDTGTTLDGKITTIDTVVDGIQTDLSNATDGLGALKALTDTLDTVADAIKAVTDNLPDSGALSDLAAILTDTGTTLPATLATIAGYIDAEVASILAAVDTEVAAIKAVTDLLPDAGALNDLAAILTDTGTTLDTKINTLDTVADAIKAVTDNLPDSGALTTIAGYCDILDHATNGLANIKTLIDTLDTVADAVKAKTDLLPSGVPKNVALSNFTFLLVLSSDHITPATGKTVTAQISKDKGAFANMTNSVTEISGGFYGIDITQAEMNADVVALKFTETDCDQRSIVIKTST